MSEVKKQVAEQIMGAGVLHVHLDPRKDGVVVPEHLRAQPNLVLAIGRKGLAVPIPDLVVDDRGVRGTLSFGGKPFACTVPWPAVFALVNTESKGRVFEADVPPDLPRPPEHESICSFCLTPKANAQHLVAGPHASICDACIRRYRPVGLAAQLRAVLFGRTPARGQIVRMPYRTIAEGCSFCEDTHKATIAGAHARICDACLDLARDSLFGARSASRTG